MRKEWVMLSCDNRHTIDQWFDSILSLWSFLLSFLVIFLHHLTVVLERIDIWLSFMFLNYLLAYCLCFIIIQYTHLFISFLQLLILILLPFNLKLIMKFFHGYLIIMFLIYHIILLFIYGFKHLLFTQDLLLSCTVEVLVFFQHVVLFLFLHVLHQH